LGSRRDRRAAGHAGFLHAAAAEGMVMTTQNQRLAKLRRNVMELDISDHPLDCLTYAANGNCELQNMAGAVGLREVRYG
jgi:formate dehydrogenase major subunit